MKVIMGSGKEIPKSHPRYISLKARNDIVLGVKTGITSIHGLISQGRGEAFDYLIGEKTNHFAVNSIEAASSMLLLSKHPVISVNGNVAALVPKELVKLSSLINAPLEVNIFHASREREEKIRLHLIKNGAKEVLLPQKKIQIKNLDSNRKYVNALGIFKADVVFVPLEDGDRTEALVKNGKKVITVDLNPMSRTAQKATITIVDNITRAVPLLIKTVESFRKLKTKNQLKNILRDYDNKNNLNKALHHISTRTLSG